MHTYVYFGVYVQTHIKKKKNWNVSSIWLAHRCAFRYVDTYVEVLTAHVAHLYVCINVSKSTSRSLSLSVSLMHTWRYASTYLRMHQRRCCASHSLSFSLCLTLTLSPPVSFSLSPSLSHPAAPRSLAPSLPLFLCVRVCVFFFAIPPSLPLCVCVCSLQHP